MLNGTAALLAVGLVAVGLPAGAQTVPSVNTAPATDDPMYAGLERLASRSSR